MEDSVLQQRAFRAILGKSQNSYSLKFPVWHDATSQNVFFLKNDSDAFINALAHDRRVLLLNYQDNSLRVMNWFLN